MQKQEYVDISQKIKNKIKKLTKIIWKTDKIVLVLQNKITNKRKLTTKLLLYKEKKQREDSGEGDLIMS